MDAGLPLDLYAASRWLGYLALFGLIGSCVFRGLIGRTVVDQAVGGPVGMELRRRCRRAGIAAAIGLMLSALLRLWFQAQSALDPGDPMTFATVTPWFSGAGSWGLMWSVQGAAAVLAAVGLVLARRLRAGWTIAAAGTAIAAFTQPLTGHAIESRLGAVAGVALQGLHLLGGGIWLGTLFILLMVTLLATRGSPADRERAVAAVVHAYSPIALFGAGMAVALGVVLAWLNVGSIAGFWSTSYGRALVLKVGLLTGVAALGAFNWLRVRPALGAAPGAARLQMSATTELVIGAALLAVTAVLVALPSPRL